jgi:hypothetical protein
MTQSTTGIRQMNSDILALNDLIVKIILSNLPTLTRGNAYLAKELMGLDAWLSLDNGMRVGVGGLISKLVRSRLLPLTYAGKTSCNKNLYWVD